jgi:hypothetical protein
LQVDAVDVVGLLVQERGLAGMEGRIEPEPPLRRVAVAEGAFLHLDIADEEPFLEGPSR